MILELFVRGLEDKFIWNFEREKREPVRAYEIYKQFSTNEAIPLERFMDFYIFPERLSLSATLIQIKDYLQGQLAYSQESEERSSAKGK